MDPLRAAAVAVGWLNRQLERLRSTMTPGQRWTAALALAYALIVVAWGAPTRPSVEAQVLPGPPVTARTRPAPSAAATASQPAVDTAYSYLAPATTDEPPATAPNAPAAVAEPIPIDVAAVHPPRVVALVRPAAQADVPGHDDGAMASAFLKAAPFKSTSVTLAGDPQAQCRQLASAADVVMASDGLGDLRNCLVASGVAVVAFDARGDVASEAPSGTVVSTRRGAEATLVDLGRWGMATGALKGSVGVVGSPAWRYETDRAIDRLKALGVHIVDKAYLDDPPSGASAIDTAARDFASKGVDVVVLATSMAVQRQWTAEYAALVPGVRSVVSDVADAIADEAYPPSFDGAVAHTSLRVPWFSRDHAETAVQAACRTQWEATNGGVPMQSSEVVHVYAWCEDVALVGTALSQAEPGTALATTLRSVHVPSPLTSDLGPLDGGGYGPTADAALVWQATCGCWHEKTAFASRAGDDGGR